MEALATRGAIGVLGGMGPAATVDFYGKLVAGTPAERDQDHLPVFIHAVPQIPDRSAAFLSGGPSPREMLRRGAASLETAGASVIVMPCNTAHLWHDDIAAAVSVPVLHIVDPVVEALEQIYGHDAPLATGLLATTATVMGRVYQQRVGDTNARIRWLVPEEEQQQRWVDAGIRAVKAGQVAAGRRLLSLAAHALVVQGARAIVLACTEVPLVLGKSTDGVPHLDSTQLLADAAIGWALRHAAADREI
jgi:aspartate racemase